MSRPPGRWRRRPHEDPHKRSDETPAPITRARFTSSRPPAATTRTPSTFGPARIRPTGPGPGRGGAACVIPAPLNEIPGPGTGAGRVRLAQCEPSATKSTPPRAVRAQRDEIRPSSIRASPPRTMRPEVTSPNRFSQGAGGAPMLCQDTCAASHDSPRGRGRVPQKLSGVKGLADSHPGAGVRRAVIASNRVSSPPVSIK